METKAPAPPLTEIGHYDVLGKIADGGMASVYKARDRTTGEVVAIKVIAEKLARDPKMLQRFQKEFEVARSLVHPHVVRTLDFGERDGHPYLVMEYVEGENLGDRIEREGRLPEAEAVRIIVQVARAMQQAHEQGILHRDIKPDNVLLARDGRALLADLGLAKDLEDDVSLTRTGWGMGTPHYMPPEQLADAKHVDLRCDIYALGATLYTAVTGTVPFNAKAYLAVFKKKATSEVTPPRSIVGTLSEHIDTVICRAMRANKAQRYASCEEFIAALEGTAPAAAAAPAPDVARPAPSPEPRPRAERRATVRYPSAMDCLCLPLGGENVLHWQGTVQDVSAGGLRLLLDRRFEPGTVLTVDLQESPEHVAHRLLVRVVRVKAQPDRRWAIGCAFGHQLSDEDVHTMRETG